MIWRIFFCLILTVGGATACGKPQPRAADSIATVEMPQRPSLLLAELHLSNAQARKIDALVKKLRLDWAVYEKARIALLDEAIAEIKIQKLERTRLEPLTMYAVAEFDAALPQLIEAVNGLHALLTPTQRKNFIGLLEGDVDESLTAEERRHDRQESLLRVLDVSSGQKTRLYASFLSIALRHWGVVTRTRRGIREAKKAFESEQFDAAQLPIVQELDLLAIALITYEALQAFLAILTPEQARTLAAVMDAKMR